MAQVTPFPWFNGNAEEAVAFYLCVFKSGKRTGLEAAAAKELHLH